MLDVYCEYGLLSLNLPSLVTLNGSGNFRGLKELNMKSLVSSGGSINVDESSLEYLDLMNLANVNGWFSVYGNHKLASINLKNLAKVEALYIYSNRALEFGHFELPSLEIVEGDFYISGEIRSLKLPKIKKIDGDFGIESHVFFNCTGLVDIAKKLGKDPGCKQNHVPEPYR
ncbi:hypothetical protein AYI68_g2893 [Smittium mucronatum]|uniref:Uncharacterized protein n=1 Tax=Smittium mucronatum TaxID=133383 RepID=A0A1R0H1G1_9FUNG|nr:hypothetical protein AYI68_g2893 [Smittium mucronatum]